MEARLRIWHGVCRHDRWAHLGGKQVASIHATRPPFWVWNQGLNQLYLSTYHLRPGRFGAYSDAIRDHGVLSMMGYSSALYELAKGCLEDGAGPIQLQTVSSEGEPVHSFYREAIRRAFGCELRESYGMVELGAAASECPRGTLHIWPDTGVIEVVDGETAAPVNASGDFLCTGLVNLDMPLIRYRNGDRGRVCREAISCPCGRDLPVLESIEGRISDVVITPDGRRLSPAYVEIIYDEQHPIAEAQLVQHALDHVTLRYVPTHGFDTRAASNLRRSVVSILGDVRVELEAMERIPRGPNGKMRAVLSHLTSQERETAGRRASVVGSSPEVTL